MRRCWEHWCCAGSSAGAALAPLQGLGLDLGSGISAALSAAQQAEEEVLLLLQEPRDRAGQGALWAGQSPGGGEVGREHRAMGTWPCCPSGCSAPSQGLSCWQRGLSSFVGLGAVPSPPWGPCSPAFPAQVQGCISALAQPRVHSQSWSWGFWGQGHGSRASSPPGWHRGVLRWALIPQEAHPGAIGEEGFALLPVPEEEGPGGFKQCLGEGSDLFWVLLPGALPAASSSWETVWRG